jgi:hypothetical protein
MDNSGLFSEAFDAEREKMLMEVALKMIGNGLDARGREFFNKLGVDKALARESVMSPLRYLDVVGAETSFCLHVVNLINQGEKIQAIMDYINWFSKDDRACRFITGNSNDIMSVLPGLINAIYGGFSVFPGDPEKESTLLWQAIRSKLIALLGLDEGMRAMADATSVILVSSMANSERCVALAHEILPHLDKRAADAVLKSATESHRPEELLSNSFWLLVMSVNKGYISKAKCGLIAHVADILLDMGGEGMRGLIGCYNVAREAIG